LAKRQSTYRRRTSIIPPLDLLKDFDVLRRTYGIPRTTALTWLITWAIKMGALPRPPDYETPGKSKKLLGGFSQGEKSDTEDDKKHGKDPDKHISSE